MQSPINLIENNLLKVSKNMTIRIDRIEKQPNIVAGAKQFQCRGELKYGQKKYDLQQYHIHTPSEHVINNKRYSRELHLVSIAENDILVCGVFLEIGEGFTQIREILNQLTTIPYYNYLGSLTTPPFSEGVEWLVGVKPMLINRKLANELDEVAMKNRNIQPLMNRRIKFLELRD